MDHVAHGIADRDSGITTIHHNNSGDGTGMADYISPLETEEQDTPDQPPPTLAVAAAPVAQTERFLSIDILRGVALLGILILNIKAFSMPEAAYMNPGAYGDLTGANLWVWRLTYVFGDAKFMSIFSMLFGAGVILMTSRQEQRGAESMPAYYRRIGWLALFGLLHAHVLWYGDILWAYALCGVLLYPVRKAPGWLLFVLSMVFLAISTLMLLGWYAWLSSADPAIVAEQAAQQGWVPSPEQLEEQLEAYRGSWWEQAQLRTPSALLFETIMMVFFGPKVLALMLLGMALYRWRVITAERSVTYYAILAVLGLAIGIPPMVYSVHITESSNFGYIETMVLSMMLINGTASVFMSMAYIAIVMLLCKAIGAASGLFRPLAAVGQMAFTNYIAQTVMCTLFFYGHGLGYFGSLERTEQMMVVGAVWVIQLIWSPIWLAYFRFGPLEWLWRSLTYWKVQPLRRSG